MAGESHQPGSVWPLCLRQRTGAVLHRLSREFQHPGNGSRVRSNVQVGGCRGVFETYVYRPFSRRMLQYLYATDSTRATGLLSRQIRKALQAIARPRAAYPITSTHGGTISAMPRIRPPARNRMPMGQGRKRFSRMMLPRSIFPTM